LRNKTTYILVFCTILIGSSLKNLAQERGKLLLQNYSYTEYKAETQNWAITTDKNGLMYIGNSNGVLIYDGSGWQLVRISNNSIVRKLATSDKGTVFVGGEGTFGFLYADKLGKTVYVPLDTLVNDSIEIGAVWALNILNNRVYFQTQNYLFEYNGNAIKTFRSRGRYFYSSFVYEKSLYITEIDYGLSKIVSDSLQLLTPHKYFKNNDLFDIAPFRDSLFLMITFSKPPQIYDPKQLKIIGNFESSANDYISANGLNSFAYDANYLYFGTDKGGLAIVDYSGKNVEIIDESIGLQDPSIYAIYLLNNKIWLGLSSGVSVIDRSNKLKLWDKKNGIPNSATSIIRYNGVLYASQILGLSVAQNPANSGLAGNLTQFKPVPEIKYSAWSLCNFKANSTVKSALICASSDGLYEIKNKQAKLLSYGSFTLAVQSIKYPELLIACYYDGIALLNMKTYKYTSFLEKYDYHYRNLGQDANGRIWVPVNTKGVMRFEINDSMKVDTKSVKIFGKEHGIKSMLEMYIFIEGDKILLTTPGEVYYYDEKTEAFLPEKRFSVLPKDVIIRQLDKDATGNYWINGAYRLIRNADGLAIDSLLKLQLPNGIVETTYMDNEEFLWIGTSEGLFRYKLKNELNENAEKFKTLIRKVSVNDSVIFSGIYPLYLKGANLLDAEISQIFQPANQIKKFPSTFDNFKFEYSAVFFSGEKHTNYTYKLKGYDKHWSAFTKFTYKEYTNLPYGSYTFYVKARNLYGVESEPAEFSFRIAKPWYYTTFAIVLYVIAVILGVSGIVYYNNRRLIFEKDRLEKLVLERTAEISQQKEEIMVQSEELIRANKNIRKKNRRLGAQKDEIEKQAKELEATNATRDKFFSIISHDLRSPLATIYSVLQMLRLSYESFSREQLKDFIDEMNISISSTLNLLENLLEWSGSKQGQIQSKPQNYNLLNLTNEAIVPVRERAKLKNIELTNVIPAEIMIFADSNMIQTVLRNLVSNAVKFTTGGKTVTISARIIKENFCEIAVADTGIGIPPESIPKLFRIDTHHSTQGTDKEKGTGLGLILCTEFVERNNGTIWVESEVNVGTTFYFTIPLAHLQNEEI